MEEVVVQQCVAQLESELQEMRTFLEEKEKNLVMAAEFGKRLLETNQDLETRMDDTVKEFSDRIEALEQEKYSLQLKLECQKSTMAALQGDLESTRSQLECEHALKTQRLEEVCSKRVHDLTSLNEDLKAEIEKLEVQVKTFQEKVRKQEETIEQLTEEVSNKGNTTVFQNELQDLEQLYASEKTRREEAEMRVMDAEGNVEVLQVEVSSLAQKVEALEEECEERCRQANSWYEALQEAKEHNVELNAQLELMKAEMAGDTLQTSTTGNSLFGEVEDRRLETERKLISLQVRHETLEKTYSTNKHQLKKIKAEMSALLCQYGTTTADAAHVQRLQRALNQSRSENQVLLNKIHKLERLQARNFTTYLRTRISLEADASSNHERQKCMSAFVDFGDKKEYIQLLEQELEQAKGEKSSIMRELEMKRTQLLWETNKLSEAEGRLHHSEQEQAKTRKELTKLRMRLQEMLEKLNETMATCKHLEGEKRLLEEQMKSRGRRSMMLQPGKDTKPNSRRTSQGPADKSLVVSSSEEVGRDHKLSDSSQCKRESSVSNGGSGAKKPINILEDLDKEFNKLKGERENGQQLLLFEKPPPSKSVCDLSTSVRTENSYVEAKERPPLLVPPKVVHVKSEESVNSCPQQ